MQNSHGCKVRQGSLRESDAYQNAKLFPPPDKSKTQTSVVPDSPAHPCKTKGSCQVYAIRRTSKCRLGVVGFYDRNTDFRNRQVVTLRASPTTRHSSLSGMVRAVEWVC